MSDFLTGALDWLHRQSVKATAVQVFEHPQRKGVFLADHAPEELKLPLDSALDVPTLQGLVDAGRALESYGAPFVFTVSSYDKVELRAKAPDSWGRRMVLASAVALDSGKAFEFERFYSQEEFVIRFQARFVPSAEGLVPLDSGVAPADDYTYVLKTVSALADAAVTTATDDGISQQVEFKQGIALKAFGVVRPRVMLAPYRTFREVTQPVSPFILRLKSVEKSPPAVALFEADGGAWKLQAIQNIKLWLVANSAEMPIVG